MKRAASDDLQDSAKRAKTSNDPFDPSMKKNASSLCEYGSDGTGHVSGVVLMTWPVTKKKTRFNFEVTENGEKRFFDVELAGSCLLHSNKLQITAKDVLQIALKGVTIEKTTKSASLGSLPMVLKYNNGVIIKFVRSRKPSESGLMVDTWRLSSQAQAIADDEWFSTPPRNKAVSTAGNVIPTASDLRSSHAVQKPVQPVQPELRPTNQLSSRDATKSSAHSDKSSNRTTPSVASSVEAVPQEQPNSAGESNSAEPTISKRQAKRRARELKKQQRAQQAALVSDSTANLCPQIAETSTTDVVMESVVKEGQPPIAVEPVPAAPVSTPPQVPIVTEAEPDNPALRISTGFKNEHNDQYDALTGLVEKKMYNLIGVVTRNKPPSKTSRQGKWARVLYLIDPSNYDVTKRIPPEGQGFTVNCFTPQYEQWLPSAEYGDIVILRSVKTSSFAFSVTGTGYWDRLRWATYNPETGKAHYGDVGNAPRSVRKAGGHGYEFCPFWEATPVELEYCSRLAVWWRAVLKEMEQQKKGEMHNISASLSIPKITRMHRLISEASPDMPPNGFFDCTVEILHGHENENDVYSLYVTDYTSNPQIVPIHTTWCPPGLADQVLRIEMWHAAVELAKAMIPGEYYTFRNTRMKVSRNGYVEGTFSETAKARKLDESESESIPLLKELLQRKKEWERNSAGTQSTFQHCLFSDIGDNAFLNCTVEILHVSIAPNGNSYLYVTDYTSHPDLPAVPSEDWSRDLEGLVVKISLLSGQEDYAKMIEPGSFYSISKLRMKKSASGKEFQGRLGGSERLIRKLDRQATTNEKLMELVRRKERWLRRRNTSYAQSPSTGKAKVSLRHGVSPRTVNGSEYSTIADVLTNEKCPNNFRVIARVVDYFPLRLETSVVLRCTNCQTFIPENRKACATCNDIERAYVSYHYSLFFCLEDEAGDRIRISASDGENSLLQGLKPADLQEDPVAAKKFYDRLKPIFGNLVEVHEGIVRNERIAPVTPMMEFSIESWNIDARGQQSRAYGLRYHKFILD